LVVPAASVDANGRLTRTTEMAMSLEGLAAVVAIVTGVGMFKREHLRNWFTFGRFVLSVEVVAVSVWAVVLQMTRITDISRYTLADLSRSVCVAGIFCSVSYRRKVARAEEVGYWESEGDTYL
jgi:uncharacterized membrane protein